MNEIYFSKQIEKSVKKILIQHDTCVFIFMVKRHRQGSYKILANKILQIKIE